MRYFLPLLLVLAVAVWWWLTRGTPVPIPQPAPTPVPSLPDAPQGADLARVIELRNLGNAQLENGDYAGAELQFKELCERLPDEPLGYRNRLIAALLSMPERSRSASATQPDAAITAAREQLTSLQRLESATWETRLLSSRLSAAAGDSAAAIRELQTALELTPDSPVLWYELAEQTRYESSPDSKRMYLEALKRSAQFAPDNLFVLQGLLTALAEAKDPAIAEWLPRARATLSLVAERVKRRTRYDPLTFLDKAMQALEQQNWSQVLAAIRPMANILKPDDAAQSDRLRIEVHSLELMARRLQSLDEPAGLTAGDQPEETAFRFERSTEVPTQAGALEVLDAAWADFDLDGREELWVLRPGQLAVYRHDGALRGWTAQATTAIPDGLTHLTVADLDQDVVQSKPPADAPAGQLPAVYHAADLDAVLYGSTGVLLLRNEAAEAGRELVAIESQDQPAIGEVHVCRASDFNSDGDLDLVLLASTGLRCWTNRGNLEFSEHPLEVALPALPTALIDIDLDRDIDIDLALGLANGQIGYLENLRYGTFRWREIGRPLTDVAAVTGLEVLDADGNGSWDLLRRAGTGLFLTPSHWFEPGEVQFDAAVEVKGMSGSGFLCGDFNNSGRIDAVSWGEAGLQAAAAANNSGWSADQPQFLADSTARYSGCLSGDLDADGDLELVAWGADGLEILNNQTASTGAWLEIGLVAQQVKGAQSSVSGRVNHYGLGSLLEVRTGAEYQARVVRGGRTHIGLGRDRSPDAVRITWTNGIPENLIQPAPRQYVCERQTLKGSCPYLYAWNGRRFEFVTDLLWAAPIGLVNPAGELVPCREWEHLLVPGPALQSAAGEYRLSLTEELWEAAYFDRVQLAAIDHPAEVAVFTNEKVGPPDIAAPKLHTVINRRTPVAVVDQAGRDWREATAEADERYARPFERKLRQGYTEPTTLELDLGLERRPERLTLFLTGWIYPTDTSINIGLAENMQLPGPTPPAISAPDASGEWVPIVPFCGFPGGKTKTIAIEIAGEQFPAEDFRLRISTSLELVWDAIFFTLDEPEVEIRRHELTLLGAELRYRGFSAPVPHPEHGPERYDYERIATEPRWPAMSGQFTRYGDVAELIVDADDRSAVLASGDELLVRFAEPAVPPPPGWVRDYVLSNVGWDKDADLHTIYGQCVEPLPLRGMSGYPDPQLDDRWLTPELQTYLQDYQTRQVDRRRFGRALNAAAP